MRTAINAVIIEQGKLLILREKKTWILPGGKPETTDLNDISCLCREVDEELSGTKLQDIIYYKDFSGITPHKGDILISKVYFANIEGKLYSVREGDSILEAKWTNNFFQYNLSDITSKIIKSLKQDNYL